MKISKFTYRAWRLFVGRIRSYLRWEFWPLWLFYLPVVIYVIFLGIKYRSLTLFTAANPNIPLGGFVGESKYSILQGIKDSAEFVARTRLIPADRTLDERLAMISKFMSNYSLDYPIVLKPDVGERGRDVNIIRSESEARTYLDHMQRNLLAQEYVPGHEFGVFYLRYPESERGFIYSITDKQVPVLTGDGRHSIEELILRDNRAICMADLYFKQNRHRLSYVPAEGEEIRLVEIGTHCCGAIFRNGSWVHTPELEARIDRISKRFGGFYFGRYDIRTPSIEDFKLGRNFKIIELNGVTSEATHIYDSDISLFETYRVLMKQWRMAFEIAAQNRNRGTQPISLKMLWKAIRWVEPVPERY